MEERILGKRVFVSCGQAVEAIEPVKAWHMSSECSSIPVDADLRASTPPGSEESRADAGAGAARRDIQRSDATAVTCATFAHTQHHATRYCAEPRRHGFQTCAQLDAGAHDRNGRNRGRSLDDIGPRMGVYVDLLEECI